MSKKVAIVSDTNCGITLEEAKELGIYLVTMPFFVDGEEYYDGGLYDNIPSNMLIEKGYKKRGCP